MTGISRGVINSILFGAADEQRFTQETPILPEVWHEFATRPGEACDLLITPMQNTSAVRLLRVLLDEVPPEQVKEARPAALQSFVAIKLPFAEVVRTLLPLTDWARDAVERYGRWKKRNKNLSGNDIINAVLRAAGVSADRLEDPRNTAGEDMADAADRRPQLNGQMFETARILALIGILDVASKLEGAGEIEEVEDLLIFRPQIAKAIAARVQDFLRSAESGERERLIWRIASNREIRKADEYSRATVKADAAFRVFDVRCEKISWAVIDSGIDRNHPAFQNANGSRVDKTYDLGILRQLLDAAYRNDPKDNPALATAIERSGLDPDAAVKLLERAYRSYESDMLDWSAIEPLLFWKDAAPPVEGHGTHVAGIIGADWREPDEVDSDGRTIKGKPIVIGLCPDIRLMDIRILGRKAEESEFAVIGALQLVRYLNSHNQYITVHGVNLSLAIHHVVENYACGRTPVCDECERLVGSGVTVVAAAGNEGYQRFRTEKKIFSTYASFSITDPGNAESVITVGATHRREPHTYGVSYFSSRGPTGDGRMKPDLVAPGERILSTLPDQEFGTMDGTSQAAPHVSAAAAMLMARFPELNRQPRRIKQLLCESATDLGRERSFQGHGLLDVLRALQSF
jgi:hypothetical protein